MKCFVISAIFLLSTLLNFNKVFSQNFTADTLQESPGFHNTVNVYHQYLSPETGLYDGSEYSYTTYYPFTIDEGDPFFQLKTFDTGVVFYNNVLYEKVPLLFDIIKEELLIYDPSRTYIIRLNSERIGWFTIWGHTFLRLIVDSLTNSQLHTGFYDLLYIGKTSLYNKVSKHFQENSASAQGLKKYVVESNEYFIKKDNQFYKVKNRTSLVAILNNKKKEVAQFIKQNKLNLKKKNKNDALIKIVAYYDGIYQ